MYAISILHTVTFLDLLGISLIIPLVPNHVRHLGGSHIVVGLLGSIYAGCQLGSGPLIGSLSDLKGRQPILIITLLMCGIAYAVTATTETVFVILLMRAVLGLFKQTQTLARALVTDYEPNESKHSAIYGKMAAISGIGLTIGPIIGGHIAEDFQEKGFTIIGVLVGLCFTLNAVLVALLPKVDDEVYCNKNNEDDNICCDEDDEEKILPHNYLFLIIDSFKQSAIQLYNINWSKYWDIFLLKALVGFAMSVYYSNYSLYLKNEYELTPKYIGYVISFQSVIGSLSSYFMGFINSFYACDDDYSLRNLHVFLILDVSLLGLILSQQIYSYVLFLIPLAIGNAIGRLVSLDMILKRSHKRHVGTLIGAANSVRSFTGILAPMIAGLISQYFGLSYVIYLSLFAAIMGTILSYYYRNYKMKVE